MNLHHIKQLKEQGKIRDYHDPGKKKRGKNLPPKKPKTLQNMEWDLVIFCQMNNLTLKKEYVFDETGERKYRFDYAILEKKWAVEYNGIMSEKSGHTTITGYTKDTDKQNLAQSQGWKVLNYTPLNCKNIIGDLTKML